MRNLVFFLLCMMVLVMPWEAMSGVGGFGTVVRLIGYVALGAAAFAVVITLSFRRLPAVFYVLALIVAWCAFSGFWSVTPQMSLARTITKGSLLLFFWMIWEFSPSVKHQIWMMRAYLLGCVLPLSMIFFSFLSGYTSPDAMHTRYTGGRMDPNEMSIILVVGMPIALFLATAPPLRSKILRALSWAYLPAAAVGTFLTGSRTGAIALVAVGGMLIILSQRGHKYAKLMLIPLTACAIFLIAAIVPSVLLERTSEVLDRDTVMNSTRVRIWVRATEAFIENPLIGTGGGSFQEINRAHGGPGRAPHSLLFSVMVEYGSVGVVLWGGVLVVIIHNVWSMGKIGMRSTCIAMLVAWGIGSLTLGTDCLKITWWTLAMVALQAQSMRAFARSALRPGLPVAPGLQPLPLRGNPSM